MSSTENEGNWVLGVTLGLLGSVAINTGNNIQSLGLKGLKDANDSASIPKNRKSFRLRQLNDRRKTAPLCVSDSSDEKAAVEVLPDNDSQNELRRAKPCSSITWVIGTVVFVSGSLLNFASYAFAAQSMLASLESIQFVTNLIFGKFMLKANVTKTMLVGTGLTVMGTILAVQFSSRQTLNLRTEDIKILYKNPAYLIYLALMVGMLFLLNYVYHFYEKRKLSGKPLRHSGAIMQISYSIWSALFGTQSVVQAKVLAELLTVHSSGEQNIFHSWFTYATLFVWIITVAVWLSRLNNALSKFDPLIIIPLLQCSFIFFAIVSGGIFFKEFNEFTVTQWVGFWSGVLVMFSGLILLTPVASKNNNEMELSKDIGRLLRSKAATIAPVVESSQYNRHEIDYKEQAISEVDESLLLGCSDIKQFDEKFPTTPVNEDQNLANRCRTLKRSPRRSLSQAVSQMNAMKDVVLESANMFLTPPTGTNAFTDAMLDAAKRKEEKRQRIEKLKLLQKLLNQSTTPTREGILSLEILQLVHDLGLEEHVNKYGGNPMNHELESLRDEIGSPREFRCSMLKKASEMEKSLHNSLYDHEMTAADESF